MPRQASKCREWEKDRRDRLNNSFSELCKKLPCYQPSINISKIEILQKAAAYIDELDSQVKDLLANNAPKTTCEKIKRLRDQIKKLLIRNEQLCNLLKDAGIKYPSECGLVKFKTPKKWANKISPDQAKVLAEKEAQKENNNSNTAVKEKKPDKTKRKKNALRSIQKARVKRKEHKKMVQSAFRLNIAQSNLLSLVTTHSCFIITNASKVCQSSITKTSTILTDSRILSTPLVASSIKPTGTVFVANNNILPFIHQPALVPTPILTSNPIIVNSGLPRANNIVPTILTNTPILVNTTISNGTSVKISQNQNSNVSNPISINGPSTTACLNAKSNSNISTSVNLPKISAKPLPPLRPKAQTRTTQVNKVPIPALSSVYNKCLLQSLKLNASNSNHSVKTYGNKKKEVDKSGSLNKGVIIKQNLLLDNNKEDNSGKCSKQDKSPTEKKVNVHKVEKIAEDHIKEPPEKKLKLNEESNENKKVPTTLTYSIDALCNDIPEASSSDGNILDKTSNENNNSHSNKKVDDQNNTIEANVKAIISGTKENNEENISASDSSSALNPTNPPVKEGGLPVKEQDTIIQQNTPKNVEVKAPELNDPLGHSELSNDIFASLSQVTAGGQNPESTSPTAAFLLAFPLVSSLNSLKVTEVIEDEATESQRGTPTLLQIGTMDVTKTTQSQNDTLTPNLLNLDNFSFFPKEFYPSFDIISTTGVSTNNGDNITTMISNTDHTSNHLKNSITTTAATTTATTTTNTTVITTSADNINVSNNGAINRTSKGSLLRNNIPRTTSSNNNVLDSSTSDSVTASIGHNKTISKKENFNTTGCISSQVYSVAKTEITYSISNMSSAKPGRPQKMEKTTDLHVTTASSNYIPSSTDYNLSYNSFFSSNETVPNNTVSISAETVNQLKQKSEKKTACYYPSGPNYSLPNVTSNYSLPTVTSVSYSLPIVTTAPYPVSVTTVSYSLPAVTTISQYNTFNPFTDLPAKSPHNRPKPYNDMLYTNNGYTYTYGDNLNTTYTNVKSGKDKNYYGFNYDNYEYKEFQKPYEATKNQHNQTYCYNNNQPNHQLKEKQSLKAIASANNNNSSNHGSSNMRPPVNWMTAPDIRQQQQEFAPFSKEVEFVPSTIYSSFSSVTQNSYFNNNTYTAGEFHTTFSEARKIDAFPTIPNSFQRSEEENHFSWSPSKLPHMLDAAHSFMSSTLPTLVGDLALGNQSIYPEQKEKGKTKEVKRNKVPNNFDASQNTFLSVSQLVDHNKTNSDTHPNRLTNRRSSGSGNRSSNKNSSSKSAKKSNKSDNAKELQSYGTNGNKLTGNENKQHMKHQGNQSNYNSSQNSNNNNDWLGSNTKNRNLKNPSSSYSAEALIGQTNDISKQRNQQAYNPIMNKSLPVPFLAENLLPYFPPVDIPQENNLLPQNQNYHQPGTFGHNFASTIQNNVYANNTFVPTNFNLPEIGGNTAEYNAGLMDNAFGHVVPRPPEKFNKPKNSTTNERQDDKRTLQSNNNNNSCSLSNTPKKSKKKQIEPTLPGLVDFSFLPMPGAINSPILPDDFHSHANFLPPPPTPTQLYPCKNPLYTKQTELSHNPLLPLPPVTRPGVPHPEISPSLNSVGSSLTNFNLSTIFPEINKGPSILDNIYPDTNKSKDYSHRDYLGVPQVSFPKTNPSRTYNIHSTSTNN